MRLVELFLNETTEEDRAIISLADVVYRHVRKYEDYIDPKSTEPLNVGKIGDFADTPLDGMEDINIELQEPEALGIRVAKYNNEEYEGKNPGGVWINTGPTIALNVDKLSSERIKSIIVHELRHALDDLKSSGKANASTRYRLPKKKEHRKKDPYSPHNYPYLAEPAEINGRFSQVLDGLVEFISKNSNLPADQLRQKAYKSLKRFFIMYRIALLFPEKEKSRDYKRLVKRAVDMINKEVKYITELD
jgi:hypothetical protein